MINWPLFKMSLKANYKIVLIFMAILTLYINVIVGMYDPTAMSSLEEFYKSMPEIMSMVGMSGDSTTLMGFLITYLYGFLFLILPLVVTIIISNKLVASHIDRGSIAYLLASPNSRGKIILTQMKVLGTIIFSIIAYSTIMTIVACITMFPGELDISRLLIINLGLLVFHMFIGSICFISSVIFNETRYSLLLGAGIPSISFLIQMLANMGGKLDVLKYLTIFSLFDPRGLLRGDAFSYVLISITFILTLTIFLFSVRIFDKRDLSI